MPEKQSSQLQAEALYALEGIAFTQQEEAVLFWRLPQILSDQEHDALISAYAKIRRGGAPAITPESPVYVTCGHSRRKFVGESLEEAYDAHERWCPFPHRVQQWWDEKRGAEQ